MLGDRTYSLLLSEKEVAWERELGQTPRVGSAWVQGARVARYFVRLYMLCCQLLYINLSNQSTIWLRRMLVL